MCSTTHLPLRDTDGSTTITDPCKLYPEEEETTHFKMNKTTIQLDEQCHPANRITYTREMFKN